MTNEATQVDSGILKRRFTISDSTAITKGTLLKLTDPRTASASDGNTSNKCAGIAAEGKDASDGIVDLSVVYDGIFECTCSNVITAGEPITFIGNNYVCSALSASGATIAGYSLETGQDEERINVRIKL